MRASSVPVDHFKGYWKYIYDRQVIWHKRFVQGLPRPWTDDPILRDYSFTNAYRELDRGTQHLFTHVLPWEGNDVDLLCRIILYRFFNRIEIWDEIIAPIVNNPLRAYNVAMIDKIEPLLQAWRLERGPVFTGAYMVCAYDGCPGTNKINKVCNFLRTIVRNKAEILKGLRAQETPRKAHRFLQTLNGIGPFNAYELYSDMMYVANFLPWDEDAWANPGPGAQRGLKYIWPDRKDYEAEIYELRDNQHDAFDYYDLPFHEVALCNADGFIRPLTMRNIEHNLCEYSKYARGRARVKFVPHSDKQFVPIIPLLGA